MRNLLGRLYNSQFNTNSVLIVLGAVGWVVSMFAQLTAISSNKQLSKDKKEFLKTQEIADGSINTGLYLLLTSGISKFAKGLVDKGKLITNDIFDNLKPEYKDDNKLKNAIKDFDGKTKTITSIMLDDSEELIDRNKNAIGLLATIGASVLSCNILTPLARNKVGGYLKEKNAKKLDISEIPITKPQILLTPKSYKEDTFKQISSFGAYSGFTNITRI